MLLGVVHFLFGVIAGLFFDQKNIFPSQPLRTFFRRGYRLRRSRVTIIFVARNYICIGTFFHSPILFPRTHFIAKLLPKCFKFTCCTPPPELDISCWRNPMATMYLVSLCYSFMFPLWSRRWLLGFRCFNRPGVVLAGRNNFDHPILFPSLDFIAW